MSRLRPVRGLRRSGPAFARRVAARRFGRAIAAFRSPVRNRTFKRRVMACVALASSAFALVTCGWRVLEVDRRATSAAEIESLQQRVRESRIKLARLPRLREAASAARISAGATAPTAGSDWQAVAELAARTGVKVLLLEPASRAAAPRGRNGEKARRALRIDGRTDFSGLHAFVHGLSTLPMLVVPGTVDIKREPDGLVFAATLNVFDGPPVPARLAAHEKAALEAERGHAGRPLADPFHIGAAPALSGGPAARLVGLIHDGPRALALFEGASGVQAMVAAPGQPLGVERVVRVDALGVTLAGRRGERRLTLPEDGR